MVNVFEIEVVLECEEEKNTKTKTSGRWKSSSTSNANFLYWPEAWVLRKAYVALDGNGKAIKQRGFYSLVFILFEIIDCLFFLYAKWNFHLVTRPIQCWTFKAERKNLFEWRFNELMNYRKKRIRLILRIVSFRITSQYSQLSAYSMNVLVACIDAGAWAWRRKITSNLRMRLKLCKRLHIHASAPTPSSHVSLCEHRKMNDERVLFAGVILYRLKSTENLLSDLNMCI